LLLVLIVFIIVVVPVGFLSFAILYLHAQAKPCFKTIQENLGYYYSIAFTMDKYSHVTDSTKQAIAERMGTFLKALNL
jgi:hypothetical protein